MNQTQLTQEATTFLRKHFDMELDIPIRISKRMTATFGVFYHNRKDTAKEIAMSATFIENNSTDVVLDVLYHECVHYALFVKGLPYRDKDDFFKSTVDRLGIARTRHYEYKGKVHVYQCEQCQGVIQRRRRFNVKNYRCGECRLGKFEYVTEDYVQ